MDKQKITRFWKRVDRLGLEECWEWRKSTGEKTQGHQKLYSGDGASRTWDYVHRFSYQLHHGQIPAGLMVCHSCDNPTCVNPHHLFLGTALRNVREAAERNPGFAKRKLSRDDVNAIRSLRAAGILAIKLSEKYGVSVIHVRKVVSGIAWR